MILDWAQVKPYFSRLGRLAPADRSIRSPELGPLANKSLAIFGLGCLGAPSAIEFAKAGIGTLRIIDGDYVDPGTIIRWPLGLPASGLSKVNALNTFIDDNFSWTSVEPYVRRLGLTRDPKDEVQSDWDFLNKVLDGVSAVYDATAEIGVQYLLSTECAKRNICYIGVDGTYGGWGGQIISVRPGHSRGCWMCAQIAFDDATIPSPPFDPNGEIQPRGCGDITFKATGFDMSLIALLGVRTTVSILCELKEGAYPTTYDDIFTVALRDEKGNFIPPIINGYRLEKHPQCSVCEINNSNA